LFQEKYQEGKALSQETAIIIIVVVVVAIIQKMEKKASWPQHQAKILATKFHQPEIINLRRVAVEFRKSSSSSPNHGVT
jgi:predicted nucleic acid-binding protein